MVTERDANRRHGHSSRALALAAGALGTLALCVGLTSAPSCTRDNRASLPRVSRGLDVRTGDADADLFFAVVRAMNFAVNEAERVRFDLAVGLSLRLGIGDSSDIGADAAEVRRLALATAALHGQFLVLRRDTSLRPITWGPLEYPPSQPRAECAVRVITRRRTEFGEEPIAPEARPLVELIERAIRSAAALEARMNGVAEVAPALREAGRALARTATPRLQTRMATIAAEFTAADEFLEGLPARARAQAQLSKAIADLLIASATVQDESELGPVASTVNTGGAATNGDGGLAPSANSAVANGAPLTMRDPGATRDGPMSGPPTGSRLREAGSLTDAGTQANGEALDAAIAHSDATVPDDARPLEGEAGVYPDGAIRLAWIIGVTGRRVAGRDRRALERLLMLPPMPEIDCTAAR